MKKTSTFFLVTLLLIFFTFGAFFCLYGTLASPMMEFFQVGTFEQGLITSLNCAGGAAIAVLIALLGDRFNKVYGVAAGIGLLVLGCGIVLAVPSFGWMLPIVFLCGVGTSLIDSMGNSLVIAYMPEKKNTFVPMLHSSHAIGTMVGPMLFPVLMDAAQPETFKVDFLAVAIAGVAALVLFLLAARLFLKSQPLLPMEKQPKARERGGFGIVFRSKYAWILVIVSICYFFFCWGKNSWLKYFFEREGGMSFAVSGIMLSAFFTGTLAVRLIGPFLLKFMRPSVMMGICMLAAPLFLVLAVCIAPASPVLIGAICAVSGFFNGMGGVTPYLIAGEYFPKQLGSASAIPQFANNAAGLLVPPLLGALAAWAGLRMPLLLAAGVGCLGAVIALVGFRKTPQEIEKREAAQDAVEI